MRRTLLAAVCLLALIACDKPGQPVTESVTFATLPQGTEIKLALMQTLESGVDDEGDRIALLVTEPVTDGQGHVIVQKGALAEGKVVTSRREDAMGSLTNRPARLFVTVDTVEAVNGTKLQLTANPEGEEGKPFELTRGNTGRPEVSGDKLEELLKNPKSEEDLKKLGELFVKKGSIDPNSSEAKEVIERLNGDLKLPTLEALKSEGKVDQVNSLLSQVKSGMKLTGSLSAVGAVLELANVAGDVGGRLSRMLKGRNIKAYAGQPMTAKTTVEARIQIP